ncbi:alpha/beta fold hydrolase [Mongoliimonas terrestris]|uniref:alpha/beta fold hydrolase n=1 Tax=Mongoliimonas terrestris TaxID=1709001 RepID=UPI000BA58841|nr:alpha/beta family hydrolase [Mongoliimonas terrestris]
MDVLVTEAVGGPAVATLLFAHGAGAPMDSAAMTAFAGAFADAGLRVVRYEFPYMAARRSGSKRPPPKAETLVPACAAALAQLLATVDGPVLLAGKSLGGRVSVLTAGDALDARVRGVVAIGYPFHPPAKPEATRLVPLQTACLPVLVLQGTRDPFGTCEEVADYALPEAVSLTWFEDGDHDLKPRRTSGFTADDHRRAAATVVRAFVNRVCG